LDLQGDPHAHALGAVATRAYTGAPMRALSPAFMDRPWPRAVVVGVLGFAWTTLALFAPARHWPITGPINAWMQGFFVGTGLPRMLAWGVRAALLTAVSYALLRWIVKRPFALTSWHLPHDMRRLLWLSLAVAFPMQILLGLNGAVQAYYASLFAPGGVWRILANVIGIASEHVWVEGVVLGLALVPAAMPTEVVRTGRLARFGVGFPADGPRTIESWFGIPRAAWPALCAQASVYCLVHFTKAPAELLTSAPAGFAVGWLSLRTRSFWPAAILHLATGAVVLATIAVTR
jgi:hypothetical protein